MTSSLYIFFLLFSSLSFARLTDKQFNIKVSENKIELNPKKGFHFNVEAPSSAKFDDLKAIFKPNPKTEQRFVFLAPDETRKAKLSFYVCDDKKTVCEKQEQEVTFANVPVQQAGESLTLAKTSPSIGASSNKMVSSAVKMSKTDKPTLLVFSAPWCPACLRLQTETFGQKSVQNEFKKLRVKKINIDLAENFELSEKFHVKAIPTVILLNKNGDEVNRWLDYQPAKIFTSQLSASLKNSSSLLELEKKASAGDEKATSQLGMNAYNAMNCEEAIRWLSLSKSKNDLKYRLAAEVQCANDKVGEDEKTQEQYIDTLKKAINETPSEFDKIRWFADLYDTLHEKKKLTAENQSVAVKILEKVDVLINDEKESTTVFAESTFGEPGGFQFEELLTTKSRLFTVLGRTKEKEENDTILKNAFLKRKLSVDKPGEMLLAIAYARQAGEKENVEKLYNLLITKYPKTYVYYEKYSRYLMNEKSLEKSLDLANKSLNYAEGNEPQLHLLKVRILKDMKSSDEALKVVNQALQLPNINHKKYKRTLAALEKIKKELLAK